MVNSVPGVSEEEYNRFSDKEKVVFDLILSKGGGINVQEIRERTGIGYKEEKDIVRSLLSKGVAIRGIGVGHWTQRYYYSPYAEDHEKRIT